MAYGQLRALTGFGSKKKRAAIAPLAQLFEKINHHRERNKINLCHRLIFKRMIKGQRHQTVACQLIFSI